ncbi:hypothetical protein EXE48_17925 [Halorubrum sp. ASP1]|uniref:hypothetical protein n=1 Tax=Halorubrum sp. ASP1 TaxID=2518114 RepID=UPI0010F9965B|nr:hypothetical protein [Halorubrum sp. ASP1]TKX57576.1 hypothetical protein EXE48_17925 [Halorubrum sp. ASP1]
MSSEESSGEVEHGIRYAKSPTTGTYYRVTAWVDHGDGKIQAREKHEVDKSEVPEVWLEAIEDV